MDAITLGLVGGVLVLLGAATAVVQILKRRTDSTIDPAILETFRLRIRAWWLLCAVLAASILMHPTVTIILFGLIAFWALREFITLTPTRPGDHRALFWVFFLCTPLQFVLVGMKSYELFSIVIPVYAFLLIPARIALSGDSKRFLERIAKIQAGLLICVYCLSYAPALLTLPLPRDQEPASAQSGGNSAVSSAAQVPDENPGPVSPAEKDANKCARLLFFFVLMVQLSDVLQYAWAQVPSKHVIVPTINPTKTWEGLLGGTASVALLGAALSWATPFPYWFAAIMSAVIAAMGFAGALTMSAIKRDRGVKDYGTLVTGHGGVLDRIDSICFAAPVFYHFTRYYLG
jgi:phosphatidate cytidylyltransferase